MPENPDPLEERILKRIPWEIAAAAAALAVGALFLFDWRRALFVLAGGLVSAAWFGWMKRGLGRILERKKRKAMAVGMGFFGVRLGLILLIFFIIIWAYSRGLLAFAAGFSAVIPVFLGEAVGALSQAGRWKD